MLGLLKNLLLDGDDKEKEVIKPIQYPQQKQQEFIKPIQFPQPKQQNIKSNVGAGMGTEKLSNTFSKGVNELSHQLKANSEATRKMTSAINHSKVSSTSNGTGSGYSTFA